MSVYVDDMAARFRRMVMCHMLADTDDELHAMADRIGVARRWHQGDHYDICLAKRALAIEASESQTPVACATSSSKPLPRNPATPKLRSGQRSATGSGSRAANVLADRREPLCGEASSPKGDGRAAG